jgi:hypothetical protein
MKRTSPGAWLRVAILAVALTLLMAGTAGASGYNLYFGDLHAHTDWSDGAKGTTPWHAFTAAKAGGAHFFATTDHTHYGYGQGWLTPSRWAQTRAWAEDFTDETFVAFAGYELWLPSVGEMNIFNTTEMFGQWGNPGDRGYNNGIRQSIRTVLPSLYAWLGQTDAVGQWNHPGLYGAQGGSPLVNFFRFDWWTRANDVGVTMIEVWNEEIYEDAYVEALDAGWQVLPSSNSDTHEADWITGWEVRTVLLAKELTREALLDAMRASRGYATLDKNLRVDYTLDGAVMGSTLTPKASYEAKIHIEDPDGPGAGDEIKLVEIVADGGAVVASQAFDSADVTWTPTLSSSTERYFFVRVTTATDFWGNEGVTAWTAPVWTGR